MVILPLPAWTNVHTQTCRNWDAVVSSKYLGSMSSRVGSWDAPSTLARSMPVPQPRRVSPGPAPPGVWEPFSDVKPQAQDWGGSWRAPGAPIKVNPCLPEIQARTLTCDQLWWPNWVWYSSSGHSCAMMLPGGGLIQKRVSMGKRQHRRSITGPTFWGNVSLWQPVHAWDAVVMCIP